MTRRSMGGTGSARAHWGGTGSARALCLVLCLGAGMAGMTGCDTLRPWHRTDDDDPTRASDPDDPYKPKAVTSDTSKIMGVSSDSNAPQKSFFSNSQRWSGFSSTARDIEKDLGVY
jgi:hypothetical protein